MTARKQCYMTHHERSDVVLTADICNLLIDNKWVIWFYEWKSDGMAIFFMQVQVIKGFGYYKQFEIL